MGALEEIVAGLGLELILSGNSELRLRDEAGTTRAPRARKMIAHRFNGGSAVNSTSSPPGTAQDSALEFAPP